MEKVIRSDQWKLKPAGAQQQHLHATVALFCAYVDLLEGVVYTHWPELMRDPVSATPSSTSSVPP